jgi:hypothetical protein
MMSLFEALESSPMAIFLAESSWAFPTVESLHVLFLVLVVGSIAVVDLRLLGLASAHRRVTDVSRDVLPVTWGSFALAVVTGLLLFSSNATKYAENGPFRIKMILLLLAGVNMLTFHFLTYRKVAQWDHARTPPVAARIAGGLSLCFWFLVVVFGRWIGFT